MPIKAIIFDFDGVLLDTETAEYQSWCEIFARHGQELPFEQWADCIGTHNTAFRPWDALRARAGNHLDPQQIRKDQHERYLQLISEYDLIPGVRQYLADAARLKIRLGIASSSSRKWVYGYLDKYGIAGHFQTVATSDLVEQVKPAPDLYQYAVRQLNILPTEAVAIEDSLHGINSAHQAGLHTVALLASVTKNMDFSKADCTITSFEQISLEDLIACF